jgi:hypothetical protein
MTTKQKIALAVLWSFTLVLLIWHSASSLQPSSTAEYQPSTFHAITEPVLGISVTHDESIWGRWIASADTQARIYPKLQFRSPPRTIPSPVTHTKTAVRVGNAAHRVIGVATWYCESGVSVCTRGFPASGAYGAAGPALRAALGNWRGRTVYVNGVPVKLIDWCACSGAHVVDVYHSTWLRIPHPNSVTITW